MADATVARSPEPALLDQRVHLTGVTWDDYERLLAVRGDDPGVRFTYLEGQLEIMTPSTYHEALKTRLARLIEAWSEESGVDLEGAGSWTLRNRDTERGLEPDECYFVGRTGEDEDAPDLAIEVVWTSGGLDKLTVYAGLGVREVWFWRDGRLTFHALRGGRYEPIARSERLPALDPALIERLMTARTSQAQAVRDLRAELRADRDPR
jgi:Uma2 family endonuclease